MSRGEIYFILFYFIHMNEDAVLWYNNMHHA